MSLERDQKVLIYQELYDLVWATPMADWAKQFNLSDNGLRKGCRKHAILVPPSQWKSDLGLEVRILRQ